MEPDERKRVAEIVVKEAQGRIPVIVQVGAIDPIVSVELARHAERLEADAVACLTPFYYHPGTDSIIEHFKRLAASTKLPVLVYNIPSNTGNNVDAKLLVQLSRIPNIVGIKDTSRALFTVAGLFRKRTAGVQCDKWNRLVSLLSVLCWRKRWRFGDPRTPSRNYLWRCMRPTRQAICRRERDCRRRSTRYAPP